VGEAFCPSPRLPTKTAAAGALVPPDTTGLPSLICAVRISTLKTIHLVSRAESQLKFRFLLPSSVLYFVVFPNSSVILYIAVVVSLL